MPILGFISSGDTQAIALLAITAFTLGRYLFAAGFGKGGYAGNTVILFFALIIGLGFGSHMCTAGQPGFQILIPCLAMWLILCSGRSRLERSVAATAMFAIMLGLTSHFHRLVHSPGWTGNPDMPVLVERLTGEDTVTLKSSWHTSFTHLYRVERRG